MTTKATKANAKKDNSNKPWVDNYPPLKTLLDDLEARCMWQARTDGSAIGDDETEPRGYVECWMTPKGRLFMVVVHADKGGWNVFTDNGSGRVDETVADVKARLSVANR